MHSALFMIKKKYLELYLFDVDLTLMEDHDIRDPTDGSTLEGQSAIKVVLEEIVASQPGGGNIGGRREQC